MKNLYILSACILAVCSGLAQSPRTVLLEVRETTQLPAVAEGICMKEEVKSLNGNSLAVISMHDDNVFNGGDPMYRDFAGNWATFFAPALYPSGLVDRVSYNGNDLNLGLSLWVDTIASRINQTSDGLVTLPEVLYDNNTNEVFVRIQVNFSSGSIENRDLRFFLYLVQDGVVANQLVDTAGGMAPCTLFSDTTDTAYNFMHNDVAIANPSGFDGIDGIIPLQTNLDGQYSTEFAFDLPAGASIDDVRAVGFVAEYTPGEVAKNMVVNAAKSENFTLYDSTDPTDPNHPDNRNNPNSRFFRDNWPVGVDDPGSKVIPASVYPNPVTDLGTVEFHLPSKQKVRVGIYDVTGKEVAVLYEQLLAEGRQVAAFNALRIEQGTYFVRIEGDSFLQQVPVVIAH